MNREMNVREKIVRYFTITRVLELGWNGIAFLYHCLWLGMGNWTSGFIQTTALLTEWFVTGIYEKLIFMSNTWANNQAMTGRNKCLRKFLHKYWTFTTIFAVVFVSTYFLRLLMFYWIGWGITEIQFDKAMINTIPVTFIGGPILGFIVIWKRKKKQRKELEKQYANSIKTSSSVGEELFLYFFSKIYYSKNNNVDITQIPKRKKIFESQ